MGYLCIIVNHDKKLRIDPICKFRELVINHYGDYLILMLTKMDFPLKDYEFNWSNDRIEIVCQSDMSRWEQLMNDYKDITKEMKDLFADSVGKNA